ncbi:MAG TPA: hypothetical protein VFO77_15495, partial [Actinoplanes sp.]|nr:hypothetical protein [Actinoplanes sp.]
MFNRRPSSTDRRAVAATTDARHDDDEPRATRLDPVRWRRPGHETLIRAVVVAALLSAAATIAWAGPADCARASGPVRRPVLDEAVVVGRLRIAPTMLGVVDGLIRQQRRRVLRLEV